MSIEVVNVSKLYEEQKALDQVSFKVGTGEVVGFLGPNGAGKSTMMKIITCYLPQSSGSVSVCGHNTLTESLLVRQMVGYLPEHNPLYLDMYVKEYLEFAAGLHKIKNVHARVNEMIEATGLGVEQHKKIGALSKGYRQRVGLAQALIHDPKVLILDEPTTGLDPNQLVEIRQLIKTIGKEKTVMLSTHIMQEVEAICNRVIIIHQGKIAADQSTGSLRTDGLEQVIVVEFDKAVSRSSLKNIAGVQDARDQGANRWQLVCKADQDPRAELVQWAAQNQVGILALQKEERSMEAVFKQLTGKRNN